MMHSPKSLAAELTRRGFTLTVTAAGRLRVEPGSKLTQTDRCHLVAHAQAIVAEVKAGLAGLESGSVQRR